MNEKIKNILIGLAAGFVSGLLGLGGGIIFVPALVFLLKRTQHEAHGTSLALIVPTATMGAVVYGTQGNLNLQFALWIAIFGMTGAYLGAQFANKLPERTLKLIYATFLVVVGFKMIVG